MNPANVPPWGCPWHGPVTASWLTLPSGATRYYPQPAPSSFTLGQTTYYSADTYGSTHRVKVPGVAAVVRSPAEQADDTAAGREWRNEAILAGGKQQLYGQTLDGWIYIDPDGARWRVSCPEFSEQASRSLSSPLPATVTLQRFGDLGRAPESYSYPISLPLDAIGAAGTAALIVDALRPDGSAAILNVHTRGTLRVPFGFLEVTLDGPGAAATVGATVARTAAQVSQIDTPPAPTRLWSAGGGSPWTDTEPGYYELTATEMVSTFQRLSTRTLALWYDDAGQAVDLLLRVACSYIYNAPRPPLNEAGGLMDFTTSASMTGTAEIRLGAALIESAPIAVDVSLQFVSSDSNTLWSYSVSLDGVTVAGNSQVGGAITAAFPEIGYVFNGMGSAHVQSVTEIYLLSFRPEVSEPLGSGTPLRANVTPVWYSRQLLGLRLATETGPGTQPLTRRWRFRPPASPSGLVSGETIDLTTPTAPTYYGSRDPCTGAALWGQANPVCYV